MSFPENPDIPCRVEADLRKREEENDANEARWEAEYESRRWQAWEDIQDPLKLDETLNDAELVHPLAKLMEDLAHGRDLKKSVEKLRDRLVEMILGD